MLMQVTGLEYALWPLTADTVHFSRLKSRRICSYIFNLHLIVKETLHIGELMGLIDEHLNSTSSCNGDWWITSYSN